jgi:hypothetical protein
MGRGSRICHGAPAAHGRIAAKRRGMRLHSRCRLAREYAAMTRDIAPDVSALAINVTIPEGLRWTGTRRGEEFTLTTLNVRLGGDHAPGDRLAAWHLPRPRRGPGDHAGPAAADIPASGADVDHR